MMSTIGEVQSALERLSEEERRFIARWLEGYRDEDAEFRGVREPALKYAEYRDVEAQSEEAQSADAQSADAQSGEGQSVQSAEAPLYMTEEDYLALDERSVERHEYVNGYVHLMCGASFAHGRIASQLHTAMGKRLEGGPCVIFSSNLKLHVDTASSKNYLYPDLMVSCDSTGWREKWLLNPRLIVEVLSPSTQHIDRREKATTYRQIPSMEEYVIAAQKVRQLTVFRRADGWTAEIVSGPEAVAEFRSLGMSIPLAEIYRGVFPE